MLEVAFYFIKSALRSQGVLRPEPLYEVTVFNINVVKSQNSQVAPDPDQNILISVIYSD